MVILASASAVRRKLLEAAGIPLRVEPADLDEEALLLRLSDDDAQDWVGLRPLAAAAVLAAAKARAVAARHPSELVIGADQVLVCEGRLFHKPRTRTDAAATLRALAGKTHRLCSAACICRNREVLWRYGEVARLTMRPLSEEEIERYLDAAGPGVLSTVGAYQVEGVGIRFFTRIEGDYFVILGLPLLPLLAFLRTLGIPREQD